MDASPPTKALRIVCTDLDGTFFDEHHTLREDVIQTHDDLKKHGIPVVPATGRMHYCVEKLMKRHPAVNFSIYPGVYGHGAVSFGKSGSSEVLYIIKIQPRFCHDIISLLYQAKDLRFAGVEFFTISCQTVEFAVCDFGSKGLDDFCNRYEEWYQRCLERRFEESDFEGDTGFRDVVDIGVTGLASDIGLLHQDLLDDKSFQANLKAANMRMILAIPEQLHFISADANKAVGIQAVCDTYGFKASQVLALGDGANDLEMISWAGVGVSMGNGVAKLKEIANHVTAKGSEGGWSSAVRHFMQIPERS